MAKEVPPGFRLHQLLVQSLPPTGCQNPETSWMDAIEKCRIWCYIYLLLPLYVLGKNLNQWLDVRGNMSLSAIICCCFSPCWSPWLPMIPPFPIKCFYLLLLFFKCWYSGGCRPYISYSTFCNLWDTLSTSVVLTVTSIFAPKCLTWIQATQNSKHIHNYLLKTCIWNSFKLFQFNITKTNTDLCINYVSHQKDKW